MNAQSARRLTVATAAAAVATPAAARAPAAASIQSLGGLHKGMRGRVVSVIEPSDPEGLGDKRYGSEADGPATIGDAAGSTIARRLIELGFVAGEPIEIIEEVRPGGDPIAVRIGASIFALRRREAQAVMVQVDA